MASTGINRGGLAAVYVASVKVTHSTNANLNIEMETRDMTTKDSATWKDTGEGYLSWSMDAEFYVAEDATEGFEELFDDIIARTAVTIKYSSAVSGDVEYRGSAFVTGLTRSAGLDGDNETYTVTFTGNGALSKATIS